MEEKLQHERKKMEQEEIRFQLDREIFAKILKVRLRQIA